MSRCQYPDAIREVDFARHGESALVTTQQGAGLKRYFGNTSLDAEKPHEFLAWKGVIPVMSPDGTVVATLEQNSANSYPSLNVRETLTGKSVVTHNGIDETKKTGAISFNSFAFSSDSSRLVVGGQTATYLFDLKSATVARRFDQALANVNFVGDDKWLCGTTLNSQKMYVLQKIGRAHV